MKSNVWLVSTVQLGVQYLNSFWGLIKLVNFSTKILSNSDNCGATEVLFGTYLRFVNRVAHVWLAILMLGST